MIPWWVVRLLDLLYLHLVWFIVLVAVVLAGVAIIIILNRKKRQPRKHLYHISRLK